MRWEVCQEMEQGNKGGKNKGCISVELSLWALLARSCFYKILAVLVLMTAAEGAVFYRTLRIHGGAQGFEWMVDKSGMSVLFLAALGIIFAIFVCMEGMLEQESRYTLMRLRVTEWHFFWTKTVVNLFFLMVLFAVQIAVVFWAARLYLQSAGTERVMPNFLFLAFYSNSFLHCLLPMAHGAKWMRNVLIFLAFSMEGGSGHWGNHGRSKNFIKPMVLYVVIVQWFVSSMGGYLDIACVIVCGMYIAAAIRSVFRKAEKK